MRSIHTGSLRWVLGSARDDCGNLSNPAKSLTCDSRAPRSSFPAS